MHLFLQWLQLCHHYAFHQIITTFFYWWQRGIAQKARFTFWNWTSPLLQTEKPQGELKQKVELVWCIQQNLLPWSYGFGKASGNFLARRRNCLNFPESDSIGIFHSRYGCLNGMFWSDKSKMTPDGDAPTQAQGWLEVFNMLAQARALFVRPMY